MEIIPLLLKELDQEAVSTRKMLERVPYDQFDWKPHSKSMSLRSLSTHLAEIPGWPAIILNTSELDFAGTPYQPAAINSTADLVALFDKMIAESHARLEAASEEELLPTWTLRAGEQIFVVYTKYEAIRHAFGQMIHHRAQLGVFLRLLNIPIPGPYGPSADEMGH